MEQLQLTTTACKQYLILLFYAYAFERIEMGLWSRINQYPQTTQYKHGQSLREKVEETMIIKQKCRQNPGKKFLPITFNRRKNIEK